MSEIVQIARRLQEVLGKCDDIRSLLEETAHRLRQQASLAAMAVSGSAVPAVDALAGHLVAASKRCQRASDELTKAKKSAAKFCDPILGGAAQQADRPAGPLDEAGTPTMTFTGGPGGKPISRPDEFPYTHPPDMRRLPPGQPLDLDSLDVDRRYLWALDAEGTFIVADEGQGEFYPGRKRLPPEHPAAGETRATHGDLVRGPAGWVRGTARAGGELHAEIGLDGQPTGRWLMNNSSSFTFARTDQQPLDMTNLAAARRLLGENGTDTSRVIPVNDSGRIFD